MDSTSDRVQDHIMISSRSKFQGRN